MKKNFRFITMLSIVFFAISVTSCSKVMETQSNQNLVFFWNPKNSDPDEMRLIISDQDGNGLRMVGYYTGTTAFSTDGKLLAVGCPQNEKGIVTEICILSLEKVDSLFSTMEIHNYSYSSTVDRRILLPYQCQTENERDDLEGILSIDWSPSSDHLIVVCNKNRIRNVCIMPFDGEPNCWNSLVQEDIVRAVWSPIDEGQILISNWSYPTSDIYLVDNTGEIIRHVAQGMNPEWSRDGKKLIYIENFTDPIKVGRSQGISMINIDGSNHHWVYQPSLSDGNLNIILDGFDNGTITRLAWSSDNRYIVFSGQYGDIGNSNLFKLDLSTGAITFFIDSGIFSHSVFEPDWGR